jgi:hypothetical protein
LRNSKLELHEEDAITALYVLLRTPDYEFEYQVLIITKIVQLISTNTNTFSERGSERRMALSCK